MLQIRSFLRNSAILLASAFFLFSCEELTGVSVIDLGGSTNTYYTDTLKVESSTLLLDSAISSGLTSAMFGGYEDPEFGSIKAIAYLQPSLKQVPNQFTGQIETRAFDIENTYIFDSVGFRFLNQNLVTFGDTLSNVTINVHRLQAPINASGRYNYNSSLPYDPTPLTSFTFNKDDLQNDTRDTLKYVNVRLPDNIMEELKAINNLPAGETREAFEAAFKGFAFVPEGDPKGLYAFTITSGSSHLALYFHKPGETTVNYTDFEFTSGRFNQIITDRSGTDISALTSPTQQINSSLTGNRTFVQGASGIATKLTFPGVVNENLEQVNRAELYFKADSTTLNSDIPKSPYITLIQLEADGSTKRNNGTYAYVSRFANAPSGELAVYVDSTNSFVVDITTYIQELKANKIPNNGIGLVAGVPSSSGTGEGIAFTANLNRIILKDFKLRLYYTK